MLANVAAARVVFGAEFHENLWQTLARHPFGFFVHSRSVLVIGPAHPAGKRSERYE